MNDEVFLKEKNNEILIEIRSDNGRKDEKFFKVFLCYFIFSWKKSKRILIL